MRRLDAILDGLESTLMVHAWSQGNGHQEIKQIMAEVHRVLHNVDLTVSGHALVNLRFEFPETKLEDDGITYHATTRCRAVTHVP